MTTVAIGLASIGVAAAPALAAHNAGHHARTSGASRLDDGKDLLPQAKISEQQAIAAARSAASGALDEVDLEHAAGKLVFNVDVGSKDVKVDASSGKIISVDQDD
jgi:uncharacterized membrane protein YkoI